MPCTAVEVPFNAIDKAEALASEEPSVGWLCSIFTEPFPAVHDWIFNAVVPVAWSSINAQSNVLNPVSQFVMNNLPACCVEDWFEYNSNPVDVDCDALILNSPP